MYSSYEGSVGGWGLAGCVGVLGTKTGPASIEAKLGETEKPLNLCRCSGVEVENSE